MKTNRRFLVISFALVAVLGVGLGVFCLEWTLRYGIVFSIKNFDSEATSVLAESLRINSTNQIRFKHASIVAAKDRHLYVCFEVSETEWESLLKSVSFETQAGRDEDVNFEMAALPWWKIEKEKVDSILCATEGYSRIIIYESQDGVRRVFMDTYGRPSGFPEGLWKLLERQQ